MDKMTIDDKLSKNKFNVYEEKSHITINKEYPDAQEVDRVIRICPAALYKLDAKGSMRFEYLGCLECGSCRVLSAGKVVQEWEYPIGSYGVSFRQS